MAIFDGRWVANLFFTTNHSVSRFVKLAILKLSRQSGGETVDGNILQTCVPKPTSVGLLSY